MWGRVAAVRKGRSGGEKKLWRRKNNSWRRKNEILVTENGGEKKKADFLGINLVLFSY